MTYLDFRENIYSANGEDGIIRKLFSDLNITDGIVCEFGASDGLSDSNTAALWKQNYQAILLLYLNVNRLIGPSLQRSNLV